MIPLRRRVSFPANALPPDLNPLFIIEDTGCLLDTPQLAAIPLRELKSRVGSLASCQASIGIALDRLFGGY